MKPITWSDAKNGPLQIERDLSFEAVVVAIEQGKLVDIVPDPSSTMPIKM